MKNTLYIHPIPMGWKRSLCHLFVLGGIILSGSWIAFFGYLIGNTFLNLYALWHVLPSFFFRSVSLQTLKKEWKDKKDLSIDFDQVVEVRNLLKRKLFTLRAITIFCHPTKKSISDHHVLIAAIAKITNVLNSMSSLESLTADPDKKTSIETFLSNDIQNKDNLTAALNKLAEEPEDDTEYPIDSVDERKEALALINSLNNNELVKLMYPQGFATQITAITEVLFPEDHFSTIQTNIQVALEEFSADADKTFAQITKKIETFIQTMNAIHASFQENIDADEHDDVKGFFTSDNAIANKDNLTSALDRLLEEHDHLIGDEEDQNKVTALITDLNKNKFIQLIYPNGFLAHLNINESVEEFSGEDSDSDTSDEEV